MADLDDRLRRYQEQAADALGTALSALGARVFSMGQRAQARARDIAKGLDPKATKGAETPPDATTGRGLKAGDMRLNGGAWDFYERETDRPATRKACYHDYHQMDVECPEVSTGLDIIARNACSSEDGDETTFKAVSDDANLQRIMGAFDERTRLPERAQAHVHSVKKLGDLFLEKITDASGLIWDTRPLPAGSMMRDETDTGVLTRFCQMGSAMQVVVDWEPWEILHIRNNSEAGSSYGRGQMRAARKAWKQVSMMEDGTVIMVLERAPLRHVHKFLVSDSEAEKEQQINQYKLANLRKGAWDTSRDTLQSSYDALDQGDIIMPINAAEIQDHPDLLRHLGITTLEGQKNIPEVITADEYFQRKLLIALQVPPAYMGIEKEVRNRSMLSHQEIEFGRMLRQTQSMMASAYKRDLYGLQFKLLGLTVDPGLYWVEFPKPSKADEKVKAEILKLNAESAAIMGKQFALPLDLFLTHFLGWSEEDAAKISEITGLPSVESTGMGERKKRALLKDLDETVLPLEGARYLADLMERLDEASRYTLEAQRPVRV